MRKTCLLSAFISVAAGAAAGAAVIYVSFNSLYGSVIGLLGVAGSAGALLIYGNGAAVGLCVWLIVRGLVRGHWKRSAVVCMAAYYIVSLIGIVLFKSPGIREVNLNLGNIVAQAIAAPAALWANVLLFVPLGVMLATRMRGFMRPVGAAAIASLLFEGVQYAAALGIADVVDVACNVGGAAVGVVAWRLFRGCLSVAEEGGDRWSVLRRGRG